MFAAANAGAGLAPDEHSAIAPQVLQKASAKMATVTPVWVTSFDLTIEYNGQHFLIPGDALHFSLKKMENQLREQYRLITGPYKKIFFDLKTLKVKKELLNDHSLERAKALLAEVLGKMSNSKRQAERDEKFRKALLNLFPTVQLPVTEKIPQGWLDYFSQALLSHYPFDELTKFIKKLYYDSYSNNTAFNKEARPKLEEARSILCPNTTISTGLEKMTATPDSGKRGENELGDSPNFLYANLGLIFQFSNNRNIFITVPIVLKNKRLFSVHDLTNEDYMDTVYESEKLKTHLSGFQSHLKHSGCIDEVSGMFGQDFHHSEQALYLLLMDRDNLQFMIKKSFAKAFENLAYLKTKEPDKAIHIIGVAPMVFIDYHSARYVCRGCELSTISLAKEGGKFAVMIEKLVKSELSQRPEKKSKGYTVYVRGSVDVPYDTPAIEAAAHLAPVIDETSHIFFRDAVKLPFDYALTPDTTAFGSHCYSLPVSGGKSDDEKKFLLAALKHIEEPVKNKAAQKIQTVFRDFSAKKNTVSVEAAPDHQ